jgi:hypothetical protein
MTYNDNIITCISDEGKGGSTLIIATIRHNTQPDFSPLSVNRALSRLEEYLSENPAMTNGQNKTNLIIKLASAGIMGIEVLS